MHCFLFLRSHQLCRAKKKYFLRPCTELLNVRSYTFNVSFNLRAISLFLAVLLCPREETTHMVMGTIEQQQPLTHFFLVLDPEKKKMIRHFCGKKRLPRGLLLLRLFFYLHLAALASFAHALENGRRIEGN